MEPLESDALLETITPRKDLEITECKDMENCYDVTVKENEGKDDPRLKDIPNTVCGNFFVKNKGSYYYETVILDDKLIKTDGVNIGYVNDSHSYRFGVGEDGFSFGWNPIKGLKLNKKRKYGTTKWKPNDIIGCKIDLKNKYIEYYLNGKSLGKAFMNIDIDNIIPGITLDKNNKINISFKKGDMKHLPNNCECFDFDFDKLLKDNIVITGNILASINNNIIKLDCQDGFSSAIFKMKNTCDINKSYYYEISIDTSTVMQFGFVNELKFKADLNNQEGVGDDNYSWGYDGSRNYKWGTSKEYFKKDLTVKNGDNIGCKIDLTGQYIEYFLNGKSLGKVFNDINIKEIKPAVSLPSTTGKGKIVQLLISKKNCKYFPDNCLSYDTGVHFQLKNICDKLPQYSYSQYKIDCTTCHDSIYLKKIEDFALILKDIGNKLLVVDFFATWCGPCVYIAPLFDKLAGEYADKAVFIKVDVDKFRTLSAQEGIKAMPTFKFYKNTKQIDDMRGANINLLESKIKKLSNPNWKPVESKIIKITSENEFNKYINDKNNKIILIDWFATWCGPCKMIEPTLIDMSDKYKDKILFLKIDVDKFEDLSQDNGISAMPTFQFYKNNKLLSDMTIQGASEAKIQANIDQLLQ